MPPPPPTPPTTTESTATKRPRLSTSCNWCRSHKLKCDTEQPSCSNCRRRGTECVTTNLRKGGSIARRTEPLGRHRKRPPQSQSQPQSHSVSQNENSPNENYSHQNLREIEAAGRRRSEVVNTTNSPLVASVQTWNEDGSGSAVVRGSESIGAGGQNGSQVTGIGAGVHSNGDKAIFSLPFNLQDREDQYDGGNSISSRTISSSQNSPAEINNGQGQQQQQNHQQITENTNESEQNMSGGMDLTMLTDNSQGRLQMMGISSSLYILIQWLDLFFAQREDWTTIFPRFRQGMAYTVEMPLPFPVSLPPLPTPSELQEYFKIFTLKVQPIYPVLDLSTFPHTLQSLSSKLSSSSTSQPNNNTLTPSDYPSLALAYAFISISADEKAGRITATGTSFLEAAYFLHAHLLAVPYVDSVRALLLLTIALRGRNKDGASWGTLGQAIRMAQSIGLHRYIVPSSTNSMNSASSVSSTPSQMAAAAKIADQNSRIWWTAYCLERIMELETGRPSAIQDAECDQILPKFPSRTGGGGGDGEVGGGDGSFDYFEALIELAKLQTQISDRLYRKKSTKRRTEQLLQDCGMLDRALLNWADGLPEGIRPGRDIFWDPNQLHLATFLSLHFHQTIIALHRPALMSGSKQLRERVDLHCRGQPWRFRLRYSMCICAASARSIVKAMNDLVYQGAHSRLITVTPVMLATVVLAIYITKTRFCGLNDADLALLVNCSVYAENQYLEMGQDPEFIRVCTLIRTQLSSHVNALKLDYQASTASPGPFTPMSTISAQQHSSSNPIFAAAAAGKGLGGNNHICGSASASVGGGGGGGEYGSGTGGASTSRANNDTDFSTFEGSEFDELWPYLWGDDLSMVYLGGGGHEEEGILNTHLLGLPLSG